jgi:hypothetical protein
VPSVLGEPFFDAVEKELDQRSGLAHLAELRVRGVGVGRIGPLIGAAAVARHAQLERDHTPADTTDGSTSTRSTGG